MTKTTDDIALASGDYLAVVKDFAMSRGIQASDLLAGSALDPADFIHPPEMVSNFIVNRIGHNLYARLENPIAEAVYYGMKVTPSSHGSLGVAIQSCKCLREGLDVLKKYYGTRLASQSPEINEHGKYLDIQLKSSLEVSGHEHEVQLFFDLSTLISMINSIQLALGKTVVDGAAIITISAPEPPDFPYHELEHCSFEFNAERLTMRIPKTWLDLPFESHNEKLKLAAVERCEQEMRLVRPADLIEKVRIYLNALEGPLPSIEHIAAEFFMSPATLKRRLSQLNSSYLDIKNEIRLARATALLTDSNKQIETIAEDLGFSDNSNFTKFFKKITGKTPKEYRNQNT